MRTHLCIALLALACLAWAPAPAAAGSRGCVTLYDYLLGNPKQYSIFSQAIELLPNLKPYSRCCDDAPPQQPALVLLPSNAVIEQFLPVLKMNVTDLLEDVELLEAVVRTHVLQTGEDWRKFKDGQVLKTANSLQSLEVTQSDAGAVCFSAWSFACASPAQGPIPICQGSVLPVNSVVIPNTGVYSLAG